MVIRVTKKVATAKFPMMVSYVCSKCKQNAMVPYEITEQVSTTSSLPGAEYDIKERANERLKKKVSKIIEEINVEKYDGANLNIKCPHC